MTREAVTHITPFAPVEDVDGSITGSTCNFLPFFDFGHRKQLGFEKFRLQFHLVFAYVNGCEGAITTLKKIKEGAWLLLQYF